MDLRFKDVKEAILANLLASFRPSEHGLGRFTKRAHFRGHDR